MHVSDAGRSTWATFLAQQTARPGWSVARLARESGIHRSTIFRWLKGDGGLTMASVRQIAAALGVDPQTALLAAGNMVSAAPPSDALPMDPDIVVILRRLSDPDTPEAERATIRATLRYLADLAERQDRGEGQGRRRDAS